MGRGLGSCEEVWQRRSYLDCNTPMHGNNTKNLPVLLSLSQTNKNTLFYLLFFYVFFSTKSEKKRAEQVLSRGGEGGEVLGMVVKIMYTHISKCKNDKIKFKK
jgi:hypothetical protein